VIRYNRRRTLQLTAAAGGTTGRIQILRKDVYGDEDAEVP
jgi:hypothetical protein